MPLFEAIVNSIQAIEDTGEKPGHIDVEIVRDAANLFSETERNHADVSGFIVTDNGVGFDEANFGAFNMSDTTFKAARGGKGIGRFTWLAAFDSAEVDSTFRSNGTTMHRRFRFCPRGSGIEDASCVSAADSLRTTTVRLIGFKPRYQPQCPKRLETIAAYIVEELLEYLISPQPPQIVLRDAPNADSIDFLNFFTTEIAPNIERKELERKGERIQVLHVRLYSPHLYEHRLYLCAHERVVTRERLTGHIPHLAGKLLDLEGNEFAYAAYVNSGILDSAVKPDRTSFTLSDASEETLDGGLSLGQLREVVYEECKRYLAPFTAPVAEKKRARVQQFVDAEGAMYRPILSRLDTQIEEIDPEASDDEIDRQLYEGYHKLQTSLREEGRKLLESPLPTDTDLEQFEEQFNEYFEKISEVNHADLARYVCHRKAIIDFLQRQLELRDDGKYSREERVHSIIFPRGKTSNDVFFEEHNLWLLDERLAFHVFLSSDQSIRNAKPLKSRSAKEPDILIFDKAFAFSETSEVPFSSITIIEFKKPQRNDYSQKENPFVQVAKYIDLIMEGTATTTDGRPIPIPQNLPFYCYIVCDVTPALKEWSRHFELTPTPDLLGYFGYKKAYNAYFEVISYSKLVADAEKRNKAFFQKLGLPRKLL